MARLPRLSVPGLPHLLIWRAHHGGELFADASDRLAFLELLTEAVRVQPLHWHGYVLLAQQVRLLLTPLAEGAVSRAMQALGRSYVRRYNLRHGQVGTLWEGRFRGTVLQPETELLPALLSLDTQPVRQGLVRTAPEYAWSSHGHYAGLRHEPALSVPAVYWQLGNTPFEREAAYAALAARGLSEAAQQRLEQAALKGWALGSPDFVAQLQQQTARRLQPASRGRPRLEPGGAGVRQSHVVDSSPRPRPAPAFLVGGGSGA